MQSATISSFQIIGVSVRTTNAANKAANDMKQLWQTFFDKGVQKKLDNTLDDYIYSIYTQYESDYTGEYTAIVGCLVEDLDTIPDGFEGFTFEGGNYKLFELEGSLPEVVINKWKEIWKSDINRAYTADLEIYKGEDKYSKKSLVDIFIAEVV